VSDGDGNGDGAVKTKVRARVNGAGDGDKDSPTRRPSGQMIYLSEETREALKAHAERTGLTITAIGEAAVQQYLAGAAAASVGEAALPAIEEALDRRLDERLGAALRPLHTAVRGVHLETAMARLEIFAHLASAYGLAYAADTEGVAQTQATDALARGAVARLHREVS